MHALGLKAGARFAAEAQQRSAARGSRGFFLENTIRTFLSLLAALAVSLVVGSASVYVALETLPCHRFGPVMEGSCAYGALWASFGLGLSAAVLSLAYLSYRVLRSRRVRAGVRTQTQAPQRGMD